MLLRLLNSVVYTMLFLCFLLKIYNLINIIKIFRTRTLNTELENEARKQVDIDMKQKSENDIVI